MNHKAQILDLLKAFKNDSGEKYGIESLCLFGSTARGTANESSDVDICVVTRTADPFQLVHIKADLEDRLKTSVDVVRLRDKMNSFLRAQIEAEGIYV